MGNQNTDPARMRERIRDRIQNKAGRWYSIQNAEGDKAVIRIYEEIGFFGVTEEEFAAELDGITASEIEVQISSPGGDVFAAIAIFNALRAHPARVTTRVDGLAASAASVIAQAGDRRVMLSSAQMMIHEAWGLAVGSAEDMRSFAELLDKQSDVIAGIYAERAGGEVAKFRDLMADETWLTDEETVEAGLADEVVKPKSQAGGQATNVETVQALAAELRARPPRSANEERALDAETVGKLDEIVGDLGDFTLSEIKDLALALRSPASGRDEGGKGSTRTDPDPPEESAPEGSASIDTEGAAALLAAFDSDQNKEHSDE